MLEDDECSAIKVESSTYIPRREWKEKVEKSGSNFNESGHENREN